MYRSFPPQWAMRTDMDAILDNKTPIAERKKGTQIRHSPNMLPSNASKGITR
jgi:hypothetical protein